MQLTKLIPSTLVFCIFLHFSSLAQQPALITTYSWDATSDLWQTTKRDFHTSLAHNQEQTLTQVWDLTHESWVDWTRTTRHINPNQQITYSLTEKIADGTFIPVIEKHFSFDESGNLTEQIDYLWRRDHWFKLYREERTYDAQAIRRIIYEGNHDNTDWELAEIYEIGINPSNQEEVSVRYDMQDGEMIPMDKLVKQNIDDVHTATLSSYQAGQWVLTSNKLTFNETEKRVVTDYLYNKTTQDWQVNGSEKTYFDQHRRVMHMLKGEVKTSFEYDTQGRLTEIMQSKIVDLQNSEICNSNQGHNGLTQEIMNTRLTREVYQYADDLGISEVEAAFEAVIYPNPTASTAQIKLSERIAGEAVLQIRDMQGRLLSSQTLEHTDQIEIEGDKLAHGAYFVQLLTTKGSKQMRLMITD